MTSKCNRKLRGGRRCGNNKWSTRQYCGRCTRTLTLISSSPPSNRRARPRPYRRSRSDEASPATGARLHTSNTLDQLMATVNRISSQMNTILSSSPDPTQSPAYRTCAVCLEDKPNCNVFFCTNERRCPNNLCFDCISENSGSLRITATCMICREGEIITPVS